MQTKESSKLHQPSLEHLNTLTEIRDLMERSSRFISLSGLSGVSAGLVALVGAWVAHYFAGIAFTNEFEFNQDWGIHQVTYFLIADAMLVLVLAMGFAIFFTMRNARRVGLKVWDKTAERVVINLLIPLITGGLFCLILIFRLRLAMLVAPSLLIFYGLALINASKYTLNVIRYLGATEIVLGLAGLYWTGYGLLIWMIGFGVLHIIYGALMYFKYERKVS